MCDFAGGKWNKAVTLITIIVKTRRLELGSLHANIDIRELMRWIDLGGKPSVEQSTLRGSVCTRRIGSQPARDSVGSFIVVGGSESPRSICSSCEPRNRASVIDLVAFSVALSLSHQWNHFSVEFRATFPRPRCYCYRLPELKRVRFRCNIVGELATHAPKSRGLSGRRPQTVNGRSPPSVENAR